MLPTIDRHVSALAFAMALMMFPGCGGSPPGSVDPDEARQVLTSALDSWRGGKPVDGMFQGSPSIHVVDHDWRGGAQLDSYEIKGKGEPSGHRWHCKVLLKLHESGKKPRTRSASYTVATSPSASIVREED